MLFWWYHLIVIDLFTSSQRDVISYLKYTSHLVEVALLYKRCFPLVKKGENLAFSEFYCLVKKMFCNLSTCCYLCRCHSGYILWLCNSLFTMDIGNYVALQIFLSKFSWDNIHATMFTILYHITSYYLADKITIVHMTVYLWFIFRWWLIFSIFLLSKV